MGNTQGKDKSIDPKLEGWKIKQRHTNMNVWRNQNNMKQQIQEYTLFFNDEKQFNRDKRMFEIRKNNPNLVCSHMWRQQKQEQFCSSVYKGTIYLQRIPVRLSNVSDLPFPDVLHVNKQALQGFKTLSDQVGFFGITQQHIGFTVDGVTKVWINKDFQKTFPSQNSCKQQQMVHQILRTIDQNTDRPSYRGKPTLYDFLYSNSNQQIDNRKIYFKQALSGLFEYAKSFNRGWIPTYLNCVRRFGTDELMKKFNQNQQNRNSFDQSSRFPSQNNLTKPIGSPVLMRQQQINNTIINQVKASQNSIVQNSNNIQKKNIKFVPILQGAPQQPSSQTQIIFQNERRVIQSSSNIPIRVQPSKAVQKVKIQEQKPSQKIIFNQVRSPLSNQIRASSFHRVISPPLTPVQHSQMHTRQISFTNATNPMIQNQKSVQIIKTVQNSNIQPISKSFQRNAQTKNTSHQVSSQSSNGKTVQAKRTQSLFNHKTTVATSQVIPNNGKFDNDKPKITFDHIIYQQRNIDNYGSSNKVPVEIPIEKKEIFYYSQRYNNRHVPQISQLSSIGNQVSQKNKNYQPQKSFLQSRGESINNSTVNFYNSYINKDDSDSQGDWQDYTQGKNINISNNQIASNGNTEYQYSKYYYNQSNSDRVQQHNSNIPISNAENYRDGTSSSQFWTQLNNFKKFDLSGTQKTAAFGQGVSSENNYQFITSQSKNNYSYSSGKKPEYMAYYQATYGQNRINNNGPNELSSYKNSEASYKNSEATYNLQPIKTAYSYQEAVKVSTQSQNGKIDNQISQVQYQFQSPPKNIQDISYKAIQSPQPAYVFQTESFGFSNPKGKNFQENLQTKYQIINNNQQQQYQVAWDPEILADLQQIKE